MNRKKENHLDTHTRDRHKLSLEHGTADNLWWKSNFKLICFLFFTMQLGYVDRYRMILKTYSIKMTNLPIHGMYFLLSHFV